ncbi:unnamed protein product [Amoebophrya sp. A25]|nr:unnamed protein product [Amoebophrya sp. A25]|eukprot:GSA25T00027119001.1
MIVIPLIYIIRKKLWAFFFQQADNSRKKRDSSRVPLPDVEECVRQLNFDDELPDLPPLPPSRSTLPSPASIMPSPASSMCSGSLMPSPASSIAPSPACSPPGDHMARVYSSSSVKRRTRQMPAQSYTFVSTAGPCMYTHSSTSYTPFEEEPVAIFEKPMLKPVFDIAIFELAAASLLGSLRNQAALSELLRGSNE